MAVEVALSEASSELWTERSKTPRPHDFACRSILGKGAFSKVKFAVYKVTGANYALKILKKTVVMEMKQVDHVKNERAVMSKLNHPFITSLYWAMQDNRCVYFVLEFVLGGDFFLHLRRKGCFEGEAACFYAAQIGVTLEYCHSKDVIYRDLKPENILLQEDGYVKLTDFHFAKVVVHRTYTICATPEYMAPEVLLAKGHGKPVDWWTLGIFCYELIVGSPPFVDPEPVALYEKILVGEVNFPKLFDKDAKSLVKRLLVVQLSKRLGNLRNGVADIKTHKWFDICPWEAVLQRRVDAPYKPVVKGKSDTSNYGTYVDSDELPPAVPQKLNPFTDW